MFNTGQKVWGGGGGGGGEGGGGGGGGGGGVLALVNQGVPATGLFQG